MHHAGDGVTPRQVDHVVGVRRVQRLDDAAPVGDRVIEEARLKRPFAVAGKDDPLAGVQQGLGCVDANEAGPAGDQDQVMGWPRRSSARSILISTAKPPLSGSRCRSGSISRSQTLS